MWEQFANIFEIVLFMLWIDIAFVWFHIIIHGQGCEFILISHQGPIGPMCGPYGPYGPHGPHVMVSGGRVGRAVGRALGPAQEQCLNSEQETMPLLGATAASLRRARAIDVLFWP